MLYSTLSAPITCQVELTAACNCRCLYCYNHWRHCSKMNKTTMSQELLEITLNELISNNVFQVLFTGGECLLAKELLFYGIDKLVAAGVDCTLNSNLTLITKEVAERLYRLGLRGILTSVSSHRDETHDRIFCHKGALDKTMRGIQTCLDAGINVAASMVVIKENAKDVIPTGRMLKSIGIKQFFATKASPPLNAPDFQKLMLSREEMIRVLDDLNILRIQDDMGVGILECYPLCSYGLPEKYPFVATRKCSAGITTVTIGSDGGIRPCSHSDKIYGNISKEGLHKSWELMGDQRDGTTLPEVCRKCSLFTQCSGGCRVDAFYCSHKYDALDPYANVGMVKDINPPKNDIELVPYEQKFYVNLRLKTRTESIGVLCVDPQFVGTPAMLTSDTYEMVKDLSGQVFGIEDVSKITELPPEESRKLCSFLLKDRILQKHTESSGD